MSLGARSASFETTADLGNAAGGKTIAIAFLRQTPVGLHFEQETLIQTEKDPIWRIKMSGVRAGPHPGDYVVIAWTGSGTPSQLPYNEPGFLDRYASLIEHATLGETGRQPIVIHHLLPNSAFEEH